MWRYYGKLLLDVPSGFRRSWETWVFWISLAGLIATRVSPTIAAALAGMETPFWLIATAFGGVLLGVLASLNYKRVADLRMLVRRLEFAPDEQYAALCDIDDTSRTLLADSAWGTTPADLADTAREYGALWVRIDETLMPRLLPHDQQDLRELRLGPVLFENQLPAQANIDRLRESARTIRDWVHYHAEKAKPQNVPMPRGVLTASTNKTTRR